MGVDAPLQTTVSRKRMSTLFDTSIASTKEEKRLVQNNLNAFIDQNETNIRNMLQAISNNDMLSTLLYIRLFDDPNIVLPRFTFNNFGPTTFLTYATNLGRYEIAQHLLDYGVCPNTNNPLAQLIYHGKVLRVYKPLADALIAAGADINQIQLSEDYYQENALITSIWHRQYDAMLYLLEAGADGNVYDYRGLTPLIAATRNNELELIKKLVSFGADPLSNNVPKSIPQKSVWSHASSFIKFDIVKYFFDLGVDINDYSYKYTWSSLLHAAVSQRDQRFVKFLLDNGIDTTLAYPVYLDMGDGFKYTAYDLAKKKEYTEMIRLLEDYPH